MYDDNGFFVVSVVMCKGLKQAPLPKSEEGVSLFLEAFFAHGNNINSVLIAYEYRLS